MRVLELPHGKSIGGTAIGSILRAEGAYQTPLEVWEVLTGRRDASIEPSLIMELGNVAQPLILKHYFSNKKNISYEENINFVDDEYSFLTAHIDAVAYESCFLSKGNNTGLLPEEIIEELLPTSIIEVKYVNNALGRFGNELTDEVPENFLAQVAWYCMLTQLPEAKIIVCMQGEIKEYTYTADIELQNNMRATAIHFWNHHVLKDIPPEPHSLPEINQLYKKSVPESIEMDSECQLLLSDLILLKSEQRRVEAKKSEIELKIKKLMGEKEAILNNGNIAATWKSHNTTRFDAKALKETYPDIYDQFIKVSTVRPFLVKEFMGNE